MLPFPNPIPFFVFHRFSFTFPSFFSPLSCSGLEVIYKIYIQSHPWHGCWSFSDDKVRSPHTVSTLQCKVLASSVVQRQLSIQHNFSLCELRWRLFSQLRRPQQLCTYIAKVTLGVRLHCKGCYGCEHTVRRPAFIGNLFLLTC
jgi:hypothetical protein